MCTLFSNIHFSTWGWHNLLTQHVKTFTQLWVFTLHWPDTIQMKNKTQQKRQDTLSSGLDHFLCTLQYTPHFIQTARHWELLFHDTQAVDIDWVQTEELQTLSTWMWVEEPTYFRQRAGRRNVTDLGARWLLCTPHWISQTPFSTFGSFNAGWTKKSDKIISCLQFLLQAVTPQPLPWEITN